MRQAVVAEQVGQVSHSALELCSKYFQAPEETVVSTRMLGWSGSAFYEYGVDHNLGTQIREGKKMCCFQQEHVLPRVTLTRSGSVGRSPPVGEVTHVASWVLTDSR